jgi:hypothetical protein
MSTPNRFDYVAYDDRATAQQATFKEVFQQIERFVAADLQAGRATSLVLTKLEEAYMWVGKAIRDEQIARNGAAALQEQRNNG